MAVTRQDHSDIPLTISRSTISSRVNKTGAWRYVRPIYDSKTAPCSAACPVGEDIPAIELLVSRGLFEEALKAILAENPFPAVCGHVCFHPCERACNRYFFDEPIAINAIERSVGLMADQKRIGNLIQPNSSNGRRIGIIGAGPSGLSAAYFLCRFGYHCDIYESENEPGGLLRWGIPAYRLPEPILTKEIERIRKIGAAIHCDRAVSASFFHDAKDRYDAVFVGCGHSRSLKLNIEGEDAAVEGLDFLRRVRRGETVDVAGTVAVIGGGNTAVDVARTLLRMGSKPIIIYRRRIEDMPAFAQEISMAREEGVDIRELTIPTKITPDDEGVLLSLKKMSVQGLESEGGRARVVPMAGTDDSLNVTHVITAVGAELEAAWQTPSGEHASVLKMSHCTLAAGSLLIAYGGDLVNQMLSVTDAIASGKQAAMAVDTCLREGLNAVEGKLAGCRIGPGPAVSMEAYMSKDPGEKKRSKTVSYSDINTAYFVPAERIATAIEPPEKRLASFSEFRETLPIESVQAESGRCFHCGICNDCDNCRLFCPEMAVSGEKTERRIDMDYCKGCGVCVEECPRNAMTLEDEI